MSDRGRSAILNRYLAREITAEQAADLLGSHVAVADVLLETRASLGRLPDRDDDFASAEFERARRLLGLTPRDAA